HSIDDISVEDPGALPVPASLLTPGEDRASSSFDVRHNFSAAVTYDIGAPKTNKLGNAILRGWSIDTIVKGRSAPPVDLVGNFGFAGGSFYFLRPDLVSGQPLYIHGPD